MLHIVTRQGAASGAMTVVFEQGPLAHGIRRDDGCVEINEIGVIESVA